MTVGLCGGCVCARDVAPDRRPEHTAPHVTSTTSARRFVVQISQILRRKGHEVATVDADVSVRDALALLDRHGVGALVVSADGQRIDGIISERDIARGLHEHGAALLPPPVSPAMT